MLNYPQVYTNNFSQQYGARCGLNASGCLLFPYGLFFTFLLPLFLQAQSLQNAYSTFPKGQKIIHYGVEDGLSQGSVYSMLKDSRGFMWFTSLEGLNRFNGHNFKVYYPDPSDSTALRGNMTIGLVEDPYGNIWVGTELCLNRYLRNKDVFEPICSHDGNSQGNPSTHYPFYADSTEVWYISGQGVFAYNYRAKTKRLLSDAFRYQSSNSIINSTLIGPNGKVWIREWEGLAGLEPESGTAQYYFTSRADNRVGPAMAFICHFPAEDGTLWLGTSGGIVHFLPESEQWKFYPIDPIVDIADIRPAPGGRLYLGTEENGLFFFEPATGIKHQLTKQNSDLSGRSTASLYVDNEGLLWINTDPNGIDVLFPGHESFQRYGESFFADNGFVSFGVRCFTEAPDGRIWVGAQEEGLFVFDPKQNSIQQHFRPNGPHGFTESHACFIHFDRQGRIWAGTYNGLFLSRDGQNFVRTGKNIPYDPVNPSQEFWDMIETPEGYLFTATSYGLYFIPPGETRLYPLEEFQGAPLRDLQIAGRFLLASERHRGFLAFDYQQWVDSGGKKRIVRRPLGQYNIKQLVPQGDSLLWLATTSGVLKTRPFSDMGGLEILRHYTKAAGLPSSQVYGLLWGEDEQIWMSTNRGISRFDPQSEQFKNYSLQDNIQGYEFNTNAYLKTREGELFFGGTEGFNHFRPPLDTNPAVPKVEITSLDVHGEPYRGNVYIGEAGHLRLAPRNNTFTLHFTAIDYWSGGDNRYRVQLDGYDQAPIEISEGEIRYTRVPPGRYTFRILAANSDGRWTETPKTLTIEISTPWYRTVWAIVLYLLFGSFLAWQWYQFQHRRRRLKAEWLREHEEAKRLKELSQTKNRLFANISHEFRTPLTVILGLIDEIDRKPNIQLKKRLSVIRSNGQNLLRLVNQMLGLARIDAKGFQLHPVQDDVIAFLRVLVDSFHSHALSRQIGLQFYSEEEQFEMDFDPDQLQHVVTNLLANAFEFTPEYGKVLVVAKVLRKEKVEWLEVKVKDSGQGIPEDKLPHIFNRFYQVHNPSSPRRSGTGIGLALVKELINLMEGEIQVVSQVGKGSIFTFRLPVTRDAAKAEAPPLVLHEVPAKVSVTAEEIPEQFSPANGGEEKSIALLIEDNPDVIYFLRSCLGENWRTHAAQNGTAGLEMAFDLVPDVIITDVMMPGMNGFEVVEQLKADERTSHIPILMLTAKATQTDKMEGLARGADAYLVKPFNKEELLLRLDNFLSMRRRLQEYLYLQNGVSDHDNTSPEKAFLSKVNRIILEHLDDADFNSTLLAREVGVGRPQLHRKLKAITGQSTSRYMRSYRLKRARRLLLTTDLRVSEVTWKTGFKSLSWFNQAYKQEFGETASETRK